MKHTVSKTNYKACSYSRRRAFHYSSIQTFIFQHQMEQKFYSPSGVLLRSPDTKTETSKQTSAKVNTKLDQEQSLFPLVLRRAKARRKIWPREIWYRFWQIFVETPEEFPILIIQSKTSASTHECRKLSRQQSAIRICHVAQQLRYKIPSSTDTFPSNVLYSLN